MAEEELQRISPMNQAVQESSIDPRVFRNALGNFATGVTIITAKDTTSAGDNDYVGTTASSFNSVSLEPPLVLWSIDKNARSLEAYQEAKYFAVNVLSADQVSLSNHFARPQDDKFRDVDFELGLGDAPVFKGCAAHFECETKFFYEGGDHLIIVGEVKKFDTTNRSGLMFHQGRYVVSSFHPCNEIKSNELGGDASFVEDYLHYLMGKNFDQLTQGIEPVLKSLKLNSVEYRVLATLAGKEDGCSITGLVSNTLYQEIEVSKTVLRLSEAGLISTSPEGEATVAKLTSKGQEKIEPLLKTISTKESEALGIFTADEAMMFKRYLRRLLAWTA